MSEISVGFGEKDITPDGKTVELAGQYYQRVAEGVHSRLKAVAMQIEQDGNRTMMISMDVASIPEDFCKRLQDAVAASLENIPSDRIIINAIHTHNAPGLSAGRSWWTPHSDAMCPQEYRDFLTNKVVGAAVQAHDSRRAAWAARSLQYVPVGHCRRAVYLNGAAEMYGRTDRNDFAGMEGGEDAGTEMLFFLDKNADPSGAIINVPCPSQVMEATRVISSDFMGALRTKLKEKYGNDFKTICQISASGCQSPRDLTRNYENTAAGWNENGVEDISDRLLEAADKGLSGKMHQVMHRPRMQHKSADIDLPLRHVTYERYRKAVKELERLEAILDSESAYAAFCNEVPANEKSGGPGPFDSKLHHFVRMKGEEAIIQRYEEQDKKPFIRIQVHCVRLGNVVFATNPFELFLDFGRRIKARSKAEQTFLIQLASGKCGYLPTRTAENNGGYGALVMNGKVGSDGGTKLVDKTVKMIGNLF